MKTSVITVKLDGWASLGIMVRLAVWNCVSLTAALFALTLGSLFGLYSSGLALAQDDSTRGLRVESINKTLTSSEVANWHVFLVAVKDYNEDISPVYFTEADVQALKDRFMSFNVPPENIVIMSKSQSYHDYYPTKEHILKQFDKFLSGLDGKSIAFVYFSGHGFNERVGDSEKSFFAPIDFDRKAPDASKQSICLNDDILARLKKSAAPFSWLCVDACCSYLKRDLDSGSQFSMKAEYLPTDVLFQQSCEDGKPAYEGYNPAVVEAKKEEIQKKNIDLTSPELKHGLFTKALLEALDQKNAYADKHEDVTEEGCEDGVVTLSEILSYVERRVNEDAMLFHSQTQRPRHKINGSKQLDNYVLLPKVLIRGYDPVDWKKGYKLVGEAKELMKQSKFEEALEKVQEARKLLPKVKDFATDEANALYGLSKALYESWGERRNNGDLYQALANINRALDIDPSDVKCQTLREAILIALEAEILDIAGIKTVFYWFQPVEFFMGSPDSEKDRAANETYRPVSITRDFGLCEVPVTVEAFRKFVDATGYKTEAEKNGDEYTWQNPGWKGSSFEQTELCPVVCVSWNDAQAYVEWLNRNYAPDGIKFKLPDEAHWEDACRAGSTTAYWWGDNPEDGRDKANVADASAKRTYADWSTVSFDDGYVYTSPVGTFSANPWGLKDMIGNVWEWCEDGVGERRVERGGSWRSLPKDFRSATRAGDSPDFRSGNLGFRLEIEEINATEDTMYIRGATEKAPSDALLSQKDE